MRRLIIWYGSSMHCVLKLFAMGKKTSFPSHSVGSLTPSDAHENDEGGDVGRVERVYRMPGLKFLPQMPQTSRAVNGAESSGTVREVFTVEFDLSEAVDQKDLNENEDTLDTVAEGGGVILQRDG